MRPCAPCDAPLHPLHLGPATFSASSSSSSCEHEQVELENREVVLPHERAQKAAIKSLYVASSKALVHLEAQQEAVEVLRTEVRASDVSGLWAGLLGCQGPGQREKAAEGSGARQRRVHSLVLRACIPSLCSTL